MYLTSESDNNFYPQVLSLYYWKSKLRVDVVTADMQHFIEQIYCFFFGHNIMLDVSRFEADLDVPD